MDKKYVIVDGLWPIVFAAAINHCDVNVKGRKVTSAGFFKVIHNKETGEIKVSTYGESVTLKLRPADDDSFLIEFLYKEK